MKNVDPLVSVLTPVRDCQRYLAETIESITNQAFPEFEFIVADNGSSDRSVQIASSAAANDPRIRVLVCPGVSLPDLRNEMVRECRGRYLLWIDADDIAEPSRMERQLNFMEENSDCAVVGSNVQVVDPDGFPIHVEVRMSGHEEILFDLLNRRNNGIFFPSCMIRRSHFEAVAGFRSGFNVAEDIDLYLRLAEVGRLANIDKVLTQYRWRLDNLSWTQTATQATKVHEAVAEARLRRGMSALPTPTVTRRDCPPKSWTHTRWSSAALNAENWQTARRHAFSALIRNPFIGRAYRNWCLARFPMKEDPNRGMLQHRWASLIRRSGLAIAKLCESLPLAQPTK